jgi:geranylgeranyl reductase family protein
MTDVLVVGGGPAGSMAALVLARAGVNVTLLDRATFPRDKLCGDAINPGAMALLERHGLGPALARLGVPIEGMRLTGPGGASVTGRYPATRRARSIVRRDFDRVLLEAATAAGARVELGARVSGPLVEGVNGRARVVGVRLSGESPSCQRRARVVIAADGRASVLARSLQLACHPRAPRRWAIGAYYEHVDGLSALGEMHVRSGHYIGVAPTPGGLTNACLVVPEATARRVVRAPADALGDALAADPVLHDRFRRARRASGVAVLGPLAVEASAAGVEGMLLAGDAAGFVDPMTGDGIRIALRGGELAADAALEALGGARAVHEQLARQRREAFGRKLRVNRLLRSLVDRPGGVSSAALLARIWPSAFHRLLDYAGDVPHARPVEV